MRRSEKNPNERMDRMERVTWIGCDGDPAERKFRMGKVEGGRIVQSWTRIDRSAASQGKAEVAMLRNNAYGQGGARSARTLFGRM